MDADVVEGLRGEHGLLGGGHGGVGGQSGDLGVLVEQGRDELLGLSWTSLAIPMEEE